MLGSAKSKHLRLTSHNKYFRRIPAYVIYFNVTDRQTDGQTDRQLAVGIGDIAYY